MSDLISRQAAIDLAYWHGDRFTQDNPYPDGVEAVDVSDIEKLPSAEPEYEPVTAKDFAKTMSENTPYSFMAWYGEALELMKEQGFVICKETM